MKSVVLFRSLLIASIISTITSVILGIYLMDDLPVDLFLHVAEESNVLNSQFDSNVPALRILFLYIILVAGVWNLKNWARKAYVTITILLILISLFLGPVVMHEWEALFAEISMMLDGALILMMFTGSIGERFSEKQKANQELEPTVKTPVE